jgi:hypothetical protein
VSFWSEAKNPDLFSVSSEAIFCQTQRLIPITKAFLLRMTRERKKKEPEAGIPFGKAQGRLSLRSRMTQRAESLQKSNSIILFPFP